MNELHTKSSKIFKKIAEMDIGNCGISQTLIFRQYQSRGFSPLTPYSNTVHASSLKFLVI